MFRADPIAALRTFGDRTVLLDEWQAVPEVMIALKALIDADPEPGRCILTGSVHADPGAGWPMTGRLVETRLGPLTVREQCGGGDGVGLLERFIAGDDIGCVADDAPDVFEYVELAFRGGFPHAALLLDSPGRRRWYEGYVDQLISRDAALLLRRADPARIRRYLETLALHSGKVVDDATLLRAAGINRKTAAGYESLLERLFVSARIPAWSSNRVNRLVRMPKRFIVDPAVQAAAARVTRDDVVRDGALLGSMLETFAFAQIQPELTARHPDARLHHLRTDSGGRREIDFVVDLGGGRIIALEVKSSSAPAPDDARHLAWLRDVLGDDFIRGAVLHTGRHAYPLGDRIMALPLSAFWRA